MLVEVRSNSGTPPHDHTAPLLLDGSAVAAVLDPLSLIEALAAAFRGGCDAPPRHHHTVPVPGELDATMLIMPAWCVGDYLGVKIGNVFPGNGSRGLSSIQASYLLFSGRTGQTLAIIDGAELTSRRTAAASSLAARYLARPDAGRLLIVGTGKIARLLAASHAVVRPIRSVEVWGRNPARAAVLANEIREAGFEASVVTDLADAVGRADIVSCCTLSREPIIEGRWLRPGVHLDLIGGFTPTMREVDDAAVASSTVFVDTETALDEAGDLMQPVRDGVIGRQSIAGDLADLASGRHPGRSASKAITLFKSVGASIEDLAAAILCFERRGRVAGDVLSLFQPSASKARI